MTGRGELGLGLSMAGPRGPQGSIRGLQTNIEGSQAWCFTSAILATQEAGGFHKFEAGLVFTVRFNAAGVMYCQSSSGKQG